MYLYSSDKDVIVSNKAYLLLSNELSLIKISSDSYKMIFLDQKPVFEQAQDVKYDKALELVLNNLADNNSDIRAISINAPRGAGKTHLLNDLNYNISKMNDDNLIVFYACCSALTQISAYGLIQNFFISFFDCPTILNKEFNELPGNLYILDEFEFNSSSSKSLQELLFSIEEYAQVNTGHGLDLIIIDYIQLFRAYSDNHITKGYEVIDSWEAPRLSLKTEISNYLLNECGNQIKKNYKMYKNNKENYKFYNSVNNDILKLWDYVLKIDLDSWKKDEKSDPSQVLVKANAGENRDDFVNYCNKKGYAGLENLA